MRGSADQNYKIEKKFSSFGEEEPYEEKMKMMGDIGKVLLNQFFLSYISDIPHHPPPPFSCPFHSSQTKETIVRV
jgi:hypothetical protein